jgi:hypothetical protein
LTYYIYIKLDYKARVPEHNSLQNRFLAVLQCIDTEGWDVMSAELEDVCAYIHNLHQHITLLCLTTRRLTAERELITLIDRGGTEAYDEIMLAG